jgi:hypothetical protein
MLHLNRLLDGNASSKIVKRAWNLLFWELCLGKKPCQVPSHSTVDGEPRGVSAWPETRTDQAKD